MVTYYFKNPEDALKRAKAAGRQPGCWWGGVTLRSGKKGWAIYRDGTGLVDAGICHAELAGLRVDGYAVRTLYSDFRAVCNEMSGDDLAWG